MKIAIWRFLDTGFLDGRRNMAVDEAVMLAHAQGLTPPTLRFFRWQPPCVSLGYFQSADDVDWAECARRGYDVVRRPTGGRAILHDQELTYSVAVAETEIPGGNSVPASYKWLSQGLIQGLRELGIEAHLEGGRHKADDGKTHGRLGVWASGRNDSNAPTRPYAHTPTPPSEANCFASAARCDLVAGGKKIVGSAQVRRAGVILQHGSVPLRLDAEAWRAVLPGTANLQAVATDVNREVRRDVRYDGVARALQRGFATALGAELQPAALTEWERMKAEELVATKYGTLEWTRRMETKKV